MDEKLKKYPKTEMYAVIDTIGVPHPYMIKPCHLDGEGIYLDGPRIEEAESKGCYCDICVHNNRRHGTKILTYKEHQQALLVEVKFSGELQNAPGLKEYLLSIKEMAEADHMAGFAFKQA
jgi:hypothetical protein